MVKFIVTLFVVINVQTCLGRLEACAADDHWCSDDGTASRLSCA